MNRKLVSTMFKFCRVRFCSDCGSTSEEDILKLKDPVLKDPNIEVFGKIPRTGDERVDELENLNVLSAMPKELRERRVARIYQRSKHVMQQGTDNTKDWILDFGNEQRWENPTMGWCSSGDPVSNVHMLFPSLCDAVCFAEKEGFKWTHVKTRPQKEFKKSYADNFTWNKRTRVSTK